MPQNYIKMGENPYSLARKLKQGDTFSDKKGEKESKKTQIRKKAQKKSTLNRCILEKKAYICNSFQE